MAATARASIITAICSMLAAAAGNAAYGWWRHGRVDWVGVLEFALAWYVSTLALQRIGKWWQKRKLRQTERSLVSQE